MCVIEAHVFSECGHIYEYSLKSRCTGFSWWQPCESWDDDVVTKVRMQERPYCIDCYWKKRLEIIKISTRVGADIEKSAQKAGLSESQLVDVREELHAQLQGALSRLNEVCTREVE